MAQDYTSVFIGSSSFAGVEGTAIGFSSSAYTNSVAIGDTALAQAAYSIAIGSKEIDYGDWETFEYTTIASEGYSIAIGTGATASGWGSVALGWGSITSGQNSFSMKGTASGGWSLALLGDAVGNNSVAIGGGSKSYGNASFAGPAAIAYAINSVSFGPGGDASHRKDNSLVDPVIASVNDPIFVVGKGDLTNAFTLYRDGTARFGGSVQIKAGSGYLTILPGGTTNRTLTLPDNDGALLSTSSSLAATKITGTLPIASIAAASVTNDKLITNPLARANHTGTQDWATSISGKPKTVAGYGITDALTASSTLNAAKITTGTLPIARIAAASVTNDKLTTNPLARANHTGTQDWATTISGKPTTVVGYGITDAVTATQLVPYQLSTGSGTNLTALNATQITTGTLPIARIAAASITNDKLTTNPLARANHTGTQAWSTLDTTTLPTTLAAHGITNAVALDTSGYVVGALRVQAKGGISMGQFQ